MAGFVWRVGSGDLGTAANYTNTTTNQNPATTLPVAGDVLSFAAPGGTVTGGVTVGTLGVATTAAPWVFTGKITANIAYFTGSSSVTSGGQLNFVAATPTSAYLLEVGQSGPSTPTSGTLTISGTGTLVNGGPRGGASVAQIGGSGTLLISGGATAQFSTVRSTDAVALAVGRQGTGTVAVFGAGSTLALSGNLYAGRATGSSGTILVTAGGTLTQTADALNDAVNGIGDIGTINGVTSTGGKGELDVTVGGKATLAQPLVVGGSGASGTVFVSEAGSVLSLGSYLSVGTGTGATGGTGVVTVQNGAIVTLTGVADTTQNYLVAGGQPSTSGTITVTGAGALLDAGANSASIGSVGVGSLTVSAGGTVRSASSDSTIRAALFLGSLAGSNGTVTVTGTGSSYVAKGSVYVGRAGTGTLVVDQKGSFTGGQALTGNGTGANQAFNITIGDGSANLDSNGQPVTPLNFGGSGVARVLNGSTLTSLGGLNVGRRGTTGSLLIDGGSTVQAATTILAGSGTDRPGANGGILVQGGSTLRSLGPHVTGAASVAIAADLAGNSGSITVSGVGTLLDAGGDRISVGAVGTGTLVVQAGATARSGNLLYASPSTEAGFSLGSEGGSGSATITGTGSQLIVTGSLADGGSATMAGGSGSLTVTLGGVARFTSGVLYATGLLYALSDGLIQFGAGMTTGSGIVIQAGATLTAHGGRIVGNIADAGSLTDDGKLSVSGSVSGAGTITVGAGTIDIGGTLGGATITFLTPASALRVRGLVGASTLSGFQSGDSVDLVGITAATLTATAGGTILSAGGGTLNLGQPGAGASFKLFSDGAGGTEVLIPATPVAASTVVGTIPAGSLSSAAMASVNATLTSLAGSAGLGVSSSTIGAFGTATPGLVNVAVAATPAENTSLVLPADYAALVAEGGGAVTLSDAGVAGAVLIGNGAADTFVSSGAGAMLIGGQGNTTFNVSGTASVLTGNGANTINAAGSSALTITTGTGSNTINLGAGAASIQSNGSDTIHGGAGALSLTLGGNDLIVSGTGALTVTNGAGSSAIFVGPGGLSYTGGTGADTILGFGHPMTIQGGTGGGLYFGGGGSTITAGAGAQAVMIGANGDKLYSAGAAGDLFGAGVGDLLMSGLNSTGNDVFFGGNGTGTLTFLCGSGNDLLGLGTGTNLVTLGSGNSVVFGSASNTSTSTINTGSGSAAIALGLASGVENVVINAGSTARTFTLFGFNNDLDHIQLRGFGTAEAANAIASQKTSNGMTVLTLSDKTTIDLIGGGSATSLFFS